jgi:hypothetical protein
VDAQGGSNQLHALAMGEGVCRKKKLFTKKGRVELEGLQLGRWASHRRQARCCLSCLQAG